MKRRGLAVFALTAVMALGIVGTATAAGYTTVRQEAGFTMYGGKAETGFGDM